VTVQIFYRVNAVVQVKPSDVAVLNCSNYMENAVVVRSIMRFLFLKDPKVLCLPICLSLANDDFLIPEKFIS
jgi:hypothetical protein